MQALHARMQPLLLFFIDGANLIEPKEPEWDLLLAMRTKGDVVTMVGAKTFKRTAPTTVFCDLAHHFRKALLAAPGLRPVYLAGG